MRQSNVVRILTTVLYQTIANKLSNNSFKFSSDRFNLLWNDPWLGEVACEMPKTSNVSYLWSEILSIDKIFTIFGQWKCTYMNQSRLSGGVGTVFGWNCRDKNQKFKPNICHLHSEPDVSVTDSINDSASCWIELST